MNRLVMKYVSIIALMLSALFQSAFAVEKEYPALKGITSAKAVFDFRAAHPKKMEVYLNLIHDTYLDESITSVAKKPEFAVIFMGGAVTLLSQSREQSAENAEFYKWLDAKLVQMAKDGIDIEFCNFAAKLLNVDPVATVEEVHEVDNGWVSLIAYQSKGYGSVAAF